MSLYEHHSYAKCIGEGFQFLAKQLLLISKVMLPYYTIVSLLCVLSVATDIMLNVSVQAGDEVEAWKVVMAVVLYLLSSMSWIIANGRLFLLYRRLHGAEMEAPEGETSKKMKAWKKTMLRTMTLAGRSLPYTLVLCVLASPFFSITDALVSVVGGMSDGFKVLTACGALLAGILLVVLAAPLVYTYYCRMMKPLYIDTTTEEGRAASIAFGFKAAYRKAFSCKSKIIGVTLLGGFIIVTASIVLLLPGIIATNAYLSSVEARVNFSDNVLIPLSGYVYMIVFSTVAVTFTHILSVAFSTALLYLHGDIYSEKENKK